MPRNKFVFSWYFAFFDICLLYEAFTLPTPATTPFLGICLPKSPAVQNTWRSEAFHRWLQAFSKNSTVTQLFSPNSQKKNSKRVWSSTQADTSRLFMDAVPLPLHVEAFVCSLSGLEPIHLSLDDLDPRHYCQWPMSTRSLARTSSQHRREHRTVIPERTPSHLLSFHLDYSATLLAPCCMFNSEKGYLYAWNTQFGGRLLVDNVRTRDF